MIRAMSTKKSNFVNLNKLLIIVTSLKHYMTLNHKTRILLCALATLPTLANAQYAWQEETREHSKPHPYSDIGYRVEMQASLANDKTPLWLNANKHGLSSLSDANGYIRGSMIRPLNADSIRRWAVGYGADIAAPMGYTSHFVVQQAFVEGRWLHGVLSVGAKEYPMQLKNQQLSSGSQTLGINARPVPQVRLALPEYWSLPFTHHWVHIKGHIAYGMMTDNSWQHDVTHKKSKYADDVLYHSKAGYLKIGNDDSFFPLSIELGLEMASQFGGKPYTPYDGEMRRVKTDSGLKAFWNAFIPGGSDATDGMYANIEGNQLGSWVMRVNYNTEEWTASIYADHFFEDQSQMFFLDYNGYGTGADWNKWKHNRYFLYSLKDIMLGAEVNIKYGTWLRNLVFEYIYTKYQSGPYNHDRTQNISDHIAGIDDYYNHSTFTGWQHWGQVIGNPLYRSPIYNNNGKIEVLNNRFYAFHLGVNGSPNEHLDYRVLATYQKGWGTYTNPFTKPHHNVSFMAEGTYHFNHNWDVKVAYGMDMGSNKMLGHNYGGQITISKSGLLGL